MKEFKVNEYITLKLEDGKTRLYIKGERFDQCMALVLNIPLDKIRLDDQVESIIDEASKIYKNSGDFFRAEKRITPEEEFWGYCSTMQAWVENNYNTKLINSSFAFPLLRKLVELGDNKAKQVFKEEVAKRFKSGYFKIITFLFNKGYLDHFSREERKALFDDFNFINVLSRKGKDFDHWLKIFKLYHSISYYRCNSSSSSTRIPNLVDEPFFKKILINILSKDFSNNPKLLGDKLIQYFDLIDEISAGIWEVINDWDTPAGPPDENYAYDQVVPKIGELDGRLYLESPFLPDRINKDLWRILYDVNLDKIKINI